jgi:accessory gene regulator protein AgrB
LFTVCVILSQYFMDKHSIPWVNHFQLVKLREKMIKWGWKTILQNVFKLLVVFIVNMS